MPITRTDPAGAFAAPGLIAQVVAPTGVDLVFFSGQVAADAQGAIHGVGDYAAQTARVAANLDLLLASVGATRDAIVKETIYVVAWTPDLLSTIVGGLRDGRSAPPASTLVGVAALFHPDALVEVEVVVAVPRA